VLPSESNGQFLPGVSETSPDTQRLIDEEIHRMVEEAHVEVTQVLSDHREQLESLAQALLKAETLDAAEAYAAAGVPMRAAELIPEPGAPTAGARS
jgi:cell division protease FtsH